MSMFRASSPRARPCGVTAVDPVTARSGGGSATGAEGVSGHTYLVAKQRDHWRVTYEETPIGAFDAPAEAARFACDVARLEAQAGVPTRVEVQAAILETHHFVPRTFAVAQRQRFAG